ncbi:TetR family transcriptional regulator C-terminal domain-containing protein [Sulfitobacter aestuarii]|uniref:TetR family transcriptional regulator C-terminal domain-containing protein n=1 Tax=Sulfitobacter aestuarii TaxID=2161676 RepID=A0ABW5U4B8_9RHOB
MSSDQPKFTREQPEQRREQLVLAALSLIARTGVRAATVRDIAQEAGVTQGLIRHYFGSKESLIAAAYDYHMNRMTDAVWQASAAPDPRARLAAFVVLSLSPPVMNRDWVSLWAAFLGRAMHDPQLVETHERTYCHFRDRLETLIEAALQHAGRPCPREETRQLAIACNGLIDGLWIEGGALPQTFADDELIAIGLRSIGALIGLPLEDTKET